MLGWPVAYSLSPVIHRAAYAHVGLAWTYDWHEVRPEGFGAFLDACGPQWRGLSITMPLKEVAATSGEGDADVALTGTANTLVFDDGRRIVRNTDIAGMADALAAAGITGAGAALLIGNGATARSAAVALHRLGVADLEVMGRNSERVGAFVDWAAGADMTVRPRTWAATPSAATDLLISTVPSAGLSPLLDQWRFDRLPRLSAVFDVIYHPWPTPLAAAASASGVTVVNGLDLLVHQAVHQVRLMTERDVPADILLSAVRAELLRRAQS